MENGRGEVGERERIELLVLGTQDGVKGGGAGEMEIAATVVVGFMGTENVSVAEGREGGTPVDPEMGDEVVREGASPMVVKVWV